ncbi:hypothetical protein FBU30_007488 [Linnemannia zychae]|nr:hypothetical protein FBU30_007488 [Linnemannia zychae]
MNPSLDDHLKLSIAISNKRLDHNSKRTPSKDVFVTQHSYSNTSIPSFPDQVFMKENKEPDVYYTNDDPVIQIAHTHLHHPTPVIATKNSSVIKAIEKLEMLSQVSEPTMSVSEQFDIKQMLNYKCYHSTDESSIHPTVQYLHEAAIASNSPQETEMMLSRSSIIIEPTGPTLPLLNLALSPFPQANLFPFEDSLSKLPHAQSPSSSTRSRLSWLDVYTNTSIISSPVTSSCPQIASKVDKPSTFTTDYEDSVFCDKPIQYCESASLAIGIDYQQECAKMAYERDRRSHESTVPYMNASINEMNSTPLIVESLPFPDHSVKPPDAPLRPPMMRRGMSFFKKKSTIYNHQAMAQSDSYITRGNPHLVVPIYAAPATSEPQLKPALSSLMSTFLGVKRPSQSRNQSKAGSFSLSFAPVSNSFDDYNMNRTITQSSHSFSHRSPKTTKPSRTSITSSFSHDFKTSDQHPMSNPSLSQSMPALYPNKHFHNSENMEQAISRSESCVCHKRNSSQSCLVHKKLPCLPSEHLHDCGVTLQNKKAKIKRLSALSTATSIRSIISAIKKPISRAISVQSPSPTDVPNLRDIQPYIHSNSLLTLSHPNLPASNLPCLSWTPLQPRNYKESTSTACQAIEQHTRTDHALSENSHHTSNSSGIKRQTICKFGDQTSFPPPYNNQQARSTASQFYSHPMSASTPCIVQPTTSPNPNVSNTSTPKPTHNMTWARQTIKSTSNLHLHAETQVSTVNAHAEISIHPAATEAPICSNIEPTMTFSIGSIDQLQLSLPATTNPSSAAKTPLSSNNSGSYSKENISFFEPFMAQAINRPVQSSSYVSFHFDLSHLNNEHDEDSEDDGKVSSTKRYLIHEESDLDSNYDSDDKEDDDFDNYQYLTRSSPAYPFMSLPNVTLSAINLLQANQKSRMYHPLPSPLRQRPQDKAYQNLSHENEDSFQTLQYHISALPELTQATMSTPSLYQPQQSQPDQPRSFRHLFRHRNDRSKHTSHSKQDLRKHEDTNASTLSLPAMLSSFLPSSSSTTLLSLRTENQLGNSGSNPSGSKWGWRWWRNFHSSLPSRMAQQNVDQSTKR